MQPRGRGAARLQRALEDVAGDTARDIERQRRDDRGEVHDARGEVREQRACHLRLAVQQLEERFGGHACVGRRRRRVDVGRIARSGHGRHGGERLARLDGLEGDLPAVCAQIEDARLARYEHTELLGGFALACKRGPARHVGDPRLAREHRHCLVGGGAPQPAGAEGGPDVGTDVGRCVHGVRSIEAPPAGSGVRPHSTRRRRERSALATRPLRNRVALDVRQGTGLNPCVESDSFPA